MWFNIFLMCCTEVNLPCTSIVSISEQAFSTFSVGRKRSARRKRSTYMNVPRLGNGALVSEAKDDSLGHSCVHLLYTYFISTFMWNLIVNYFRSLEQTSTCLFQSYFRGYCARQFVKCIHASIIIQTAYRRYFARRRYLVLRKATVYIQSVQRMKREQTRYEELRNTTMKLQRRVKANQLGRKVKAEYLETCYNIIQLQALWRGSKAREIVRRMKSARVIQQWYRACVEGRRVRAQFVLVRKAVITMQACYRGNVARQQFKRERAARTIQAHVRGYQARALVKVYDLSYNLNIWSPSIKLCMSLIIQ